MRRLLIVGFGDIGSRMISLLRGRYRVFALARSAERAAQMRALGVIPVHGDLDQPETLRRLYGLAQDLLHFAPPPTVGADDPRTANLLCALTGRGTLPQRFARQWAIPSRVIYLSTSGVYGDRAGAIVRETDTVSPDTERAHRRVAAERRLRAFGQHFGARVSVLRVPGIYAHDRLPLERLRRGTPSLLPQEDSYTNHVHADDLARVVLMALHRGSAGRVYHATDGQWMKAGDYFDAVADAFALPRPERVTRAAASERIPANALSFLRESRRLDNRRVTRELGMRFRYPTVAATLARARAGAGGARRD